MFWLMRSAKVLNRQRHYHDFGFLYIFYLFWVIGPGHFFRTVNLHFMCQYEPLAISVDSHLDGGKDEQ